jgi:hypothetical protein
MNITLKVCCWVGLSITLSIASCFAIVPVNTINSNSVIQGGSYYNTPDSVTAFRNTSGSGLWLKSGTLLRALEVMDSSGKLTNNGGTVQLFAPGSVVRVDGTIDVRSVQNPLGGSYLGNGGNVFINAAYLYQNGHIMASGINGGLVQADVGSITMTPGSTITANGMGGQGGIVSIHASGPVDLQRGSLIDTSGKVRAAFDTDVINIEGSLINAESTLRANGIQDRGGTIRLVSTGQSDLTQTQIGIQQGVKAGILSQSMASGIHGRQASLVAKADGDTLIAGKDPEHAPALISVQGTGLSISPNNDPVDSTSRSGDGER